MARASNSDVARVADPMSKSYISIELRQLVSEESQYRCGYCLTAQRIIGRPMVFDHLIPEANLPEILFNGRY